jgi:hypothetical protein
MTDRMLLLQSELTALTDFRNTILAEFMNLFPSPSQLEHFEHVLNDGISIQRSGKIKELEVLRRHSQ